jgi:hypothetical protein
LGNSTLSLRDWSPNPFSLILKLLRSTPTPKTTMLSESRVPWYWTAPLDSRRSSVLLLANQLGIS